MAKLQGDFRKLAQLAKQLGALSDPSTLRPLNESLKEETLALVSQGFKRARDPYGKPWEAPNNLQITGGIRRYAGDSSAGGFRVFATDKKAIWHHAPRKRRAWGGKSLPTRLQVPVPSRGLPRRYRDAYVETIRDFARSKLTL